MSSLLTNLPVIQKLAQDLVRAKKLNYSEQCIPYYVNESKFIIDEIMDLESSKKTFLKSTLIKHRVPNTKNDEARISMIDKSKRTTNISSSMHREDLSSQNNPSQEHIFHNKKCIVFLHGLGSSRLESLPLVEFLPKQYCIFTFDSSGSGKSEGENITYGMRQSQDIQHILLYLHDKKGIKEFILWGRSMGAVAALLFIRNLQAKYKSSNFVHEEENQFTVKKPIRIIDRIKGMVIDSPFSNFRQITKQIALQRINIPQFLVDVTLNFISQNFETILKDQKTGKSYNPFQIKFDEQNPLETSIPAIFVHSQIDQVVKKEHSLKIIKNFKGVYQKLSMQNCTHNQTRPKAIIQQIFQILGKFYIRSNTYKRNCLSLHKNRHQANPLQNSINQRRRSRGIQVMAHSTDKSPRKTSRTSIDSRLISKNIEQIQCKKKPISIQKLESYSSLKVQPKARNMARSTNKAPRVNGIKKNHACSVQGGDIKYQTISYSREKHSKVRQSSEQLQQNLQKCLDAPINQFRQKYLETMKNKDMRKQQNMNSSKMVLLLNTIQTDNSEFIRKKLDQNLKLNCNRQEQSTKAIFKGRRNCRAIKKMEYQLNHTRYL